AGGTAPPTTQKPTTPPYRTLFNMAILVITVQAAGRAYRALGGHLDHNVEAMVIPIAGMALTYSFVNTVPIAVAVGLTTRQSPWEVWKTDFASSAPTYLLGAAAAAVVIQVTQSSGYWLARLLAAAGG